MTFGMKSRNIRQYFAKFTSFLVNPRRKLLVMLFVKNKIFKILSIRMYIRKKKKEYVCWHFVNQHPLSQQTSHIPNISYPGHSTPQTSHRLIIPHLQHPKSQTSHTSNIPYSEHPNPEHPSSETSHIQNVPNLEHTTSWIFQILNIPPPEHHTFWTLIFRTSNIPHSEHPTS